MGTPILIRSWPRAIAHVDADAFFASVEQALDPKLKGRPVATGAERGIIAAASYEAKARGVKRGVSIFEAKRICPECVFISSDYETYSIYSKRMFSIIRRFTPVVEEYSIDEAFADFTGLRRLFRTNYVSIAQMIQTTIEAELGITVSVGLSLSKSLAKLCSKLKKPRGLVAVGGRHIHELLMKTEVETVWGFGPNTSALLRKHGIKTAYDFVSRPIDFASKLIGKIGRELWMELRGECVHSVSNEEKKPQLSISKAKTFTPPSSDRTYVFAQALRNLESACIKARRYGLAAKRLILSLRKQNFDGRSAETKIFKPTSSTNELTSALASLFDEIFEPKKPYRATNVVLAELVDASTCQYGLFDDVERTVANEKLFQAVDEISNEYGKHTVFLAASASARTQHEGDRAKKPKRKERRLSGESERKFVGLPVFK